MDESRTTTETSEVALQFDDDGNKILNNYKFIKLLGRGSYSKVKLVEDVNTKTFYAAKIINRKVLGKKNKGFSFSESGGQLVVNSLLQDAMKEIAILKKMFHRNIIWLKEIINNDDNGKIYLILEHAGGGPIMEYDEENRSFSINKNYMKSGKVQYNEIDLKDIMRDIVAGLDYLHLNDIVHRDIKPDNILIDEERVCKITDFNVSSMLEGGGDSMNKTEGTVYFYSPEICKAEADTFKGKPVDIWALGVTLFIMIYNKLPFECQDGNMIDLLDRISEGKIEYPDTRVISEGLKTFLEKMLEKDPSKRATIEELKDDPWLNKDRTRLKDMNHLKVNVTDEEIKKSLNFFFIMKKTKKIAQGFREKIKTLSMKRNQGNGEEQNVKINNDEMLTKYKTEAIGSKTEFDKVDEKSEDLYQKEKEEKKEKIKNQEEKKEPSLKINKSLLVSPEQLKEIQESFELFDFNKTGLLDPEELKSTMEHLGLDKTNPLVYEIFVNFCSKEDKRKGVDFDSFLESFVERTLDLTSKEGLQRVFNLFFDPYTNSLTFSSIKAISREIGSQFSNDDLQNLLKSASKLGSELTFEDFYNVMTRKKLK